LCHCQPFFGFHFSYQFSTEYQNDCTLKIEDKYSTPEV
jgi:hypothetical protein